MSDDKRTSSGEGGQDLYDNFVTKLFDALMRTGIAVEDIERAANDESIMAEIGSACALVLREHTVKTDAAIDSLPTGRIIPVNLEVALRTAPKLIHGQEEGYHCRILPSWTFNRRQLGLANPIEHFGSGMSGISVWTLMADEYSRLLPNANILDVFHEYPMLVPAAWLDKRFYAFGTKIKAEGHEWVRGMYRERGIWTQHLERLDRPWQANDLVLIFQPSA